MCHVGVFALIVRGVFCYWEELDAAPGNPPTEHHLLPLDQLDLVF